jgi:NTP pyrophosphatase (non-canonical NTP hydrolase)
MKEDSLNDFQRSDSTLGESVKLVFNEMPWSPSFDYLIEAVIKWGGDKGLMKEENASRQMLKVMEEVGELAGALAKKRDGDIIDALGDSFVTLIILCGQLGLRPAETLEAAYNEIKNRTGKTENGVFIKNS